MPKPIYVYAYDIFVAIGDYLIQDTFILFHFTAEGFGFLKWLGKYPTIPRGSVSGNVGTSIEGEPQRQRSGSRCCPRGRRSDPGWPSLDA